MNSPSFNSTVILQFNDKPLGSGFLVHNSGLIATCHHILSNLFNQQPKDAVGEILDFVTLLDRKSSNPAVYHAQVTDYQNEKNDVALLKIQGKLPGRLQAVKLIRSEHPLVSGAEFSLDGYAEVPDPGVRYGYFSARGKVENTIPRQQVKVLKITSKDLFPGLSGGAIYATHLGGVVGMQSRRLSLDPKESNWGRDMGFACISEAIASLVPDTLKVHDPTMSTAAYSLGIPQTINAQTLQFAGGINTQAVMFADLRLAKSWQRPMEVSWPAQQAIQRSTQLQTIQEYLEADHRDLGATGLALWGSDGSGKTTLSEQYARQYGQEETYPGGVVYVKLGEQFDPQQDLKPILAQWAEYGYGGTQQLADLLGKQQVDIMPEDISRLFSGHGKMLAVLDDVHNGEHLNQLLKALPTETDLLITTPSQQSLEGAVIVLQFLEVQGLQPEDAILFLENLLPQLPVDLLRQLAATFDYHPQSLLLITAELLRSPNPNAVVQQLLSQQDHEVLAPIRTALKYSYQQLASEDNRQRFRQLGSLCPPPIVLSLELAAVIWDLDPESAGKFLKVLQERTLVTQVGGQSWSLNSLTYRFANDLVTKESELIELTQSRYYLYSYQLAIAVAVWNINHPELPHLRYVGHQLIHEFASTYALDFSTLEIAPDEALSDDQRGYLRAIANYLISASDYLLQPEAQKFAERWLRAVVMLGQVLDESAIAALGFYLLGQWILQYDNDRDSKCSPRAVQMFDQAHSFWKRAEDIESAGYALVRKGNALRLEGETKQALAIFEMALEEIQAAGEEDWQLRSTILVSLSRQYLSINEHEQARQYLEKATEVCQGQPFNDLTVEIAQQFSMLLLNRGKPQESMKWLQKVREQAVNMESERIVAEIDISIGFSLIYLGESNAAIKTFERVLKQAEELAYPQLRPPTLTGLATVSFTNGELQCARDHLEEALKLLEGYQDKSQEAQVLASLGEVALAMNEADVALPYLKRALPLLQTVQDTTTAVRTLDNIGLVYQQTNRISEGLTFLKEILPRIRELNNAGAEVTILNWLAQLLNNVGDVGQAMAYFDEAEPIIAKIDNSIERATIQTLRANLYLFIGKIDKAADKTREVIDIWRKLRNQPKLSEALMLLANIFFRQSKTDQVKQLLEEVNDLTQEDDRTLARALYYSLRGSVELQAVSLSPDRLNDAQLMYERSIAINKFVRSPELRIINLTNVGWVNFIKQDFEGAQKYFEESFAVAEEQESAAHIASTLTNLGFLVYLRGEPKEGVQYFEQAISRMEEAGITTDASNQNIESLRLIIRNIREEDGGILPEASLKMLLSVENWQSLRFILEMRQDSLCSAQADQIIAVTIRSAERQGQSNLVRILYYYRSLLERCRDENQIPSIQAMQQELEPVAVESWWASLQRQNRNYGVALTHINRVLELDSTDINALVERGWIYRGLGRLSEAIADFDEVLKFHRQDYRPYQGKGVIFLEWGKRQNAIEILTKAIDLFPQDAYSYNWRGIAYQYLGDFKSSLEDLNQAVGIEPKKSDHRYYRALLYLVTEKFVDARRELTEAIKLDEDNYSALAFDYFWRGVANDQLKDFEGARFDWETGLPYSRQIGYALWSSPLYDSVNSPKEVEEKFRSLLHGSFYWHILPVQVQNQKILEKLYPEKNCYSMAKEMLEQKLNNFLSGL